MPRILVIEDNGDLQALMSFALNKEGYAVEYAFNGREGYQKIISLHPDLVMLDLMLPIMSGEEVLKKIQADPAVRDIPVIIMTAHGDSENIMERKLKAGGAREYVQKPFNIREVVRLVGRTLAGTPAAQPTPGKMLSKGDIRLDTGYRTVWVKDHLTATLTPKESKLLATLISSVGPVRRDKLIGLIWGSTGNSAGLEKLVQRLRENLGDEGKRLQTSSDGYELIG